MKRHLTRALRLTVTVIIVAMLVIFATKVNWHATWQAIENSSLSLLLAAALVNLLSLGLKGVRWWVFLRPIGVTSLWLALRATFAGAGLNNVLVANSGEAARVIFVSRSAHVTSAKVLATLALERLFELIGYVVMLALAVSFLPLPSALERTRPFAWIALALIAAMLVYLVRRPEGAEHVATATELGWPAPSSRTIASPDTTGTSTNNPSAMISEAIETCCRSIPRVLITPNVMASVMGIDAAIRMAVRQLQKPIKATTTTSTNASIKLWLKSSMLSCTCKGWSEVRARTRSAGSVFLTLSRLASNCFPNELICSPFLICTESVMARVVAHLPFSSRRVYRFMNEGGFS